MSEWCPWNLHCNPKPPPRSRHPASVGEPVHAESTAHMRRQVLNLLHQEQASCVNTSCVRMLETAGKFQAGDAGRATEVDFPALRAHM